MDCTDASAPVSDPVKTVVICDTEPVAIEGLRALLTAAELRVVAAESCLASGVDAVGEFKPSVVVVDKAFGLHPVLDAVRSMSFTEPTTRTVVWGATMTESETLRMMHAGALGVIKKSAPLETLLECVTTAAAGSPWLEGAQEANGRSGPLPLTAREMQVVELVERGLTNREIGVDLGIRTGTVKIHLKHIFEKTGVHGRYGLALSGLKEKWFLSATAAVM
jgi:DNA-binding NarL/FixJ family response regulator